MPEYRVSWYIDIYADSEVEAAKEALEIQRNKESIATVFDVQKWSNDLLSLGPIHVVDLLEPNNEPH